MASRARQVRWWPREAGDSGSRRRRESIRIASDVHGETQGVWFGSRGGTSSAPLADCSLDAERWLTRVGVNNGGTGIRCGMSVGTVGCGRAPFGCLQRTGEGRAGDFAFEWMVSNRRVPPVDHPLRGGSEPGVACEGLTWVSMDILGPRCQTIVVGGAHAWPWSVKFGKGGHHGG